MRCMTLSEAVATLERAGVSVEPLGTPEGATRPLWRLNDHVAFDAPGVIAQAHRAIGGLLIIRRLDAEDSARIECADCWRPDIEVPPRAAYSVTSYPLHGMVGPFFWYFCADHVARFRESDNAVEVPDAATA